MSLDYDTAVAIPVRSMEQRMEALSIANGIRIDRAALKRRIKSGAVQAQELVMLPPVCVANMYISDLLRAVPKFGHVKVGRCLNTLRISSHKRVGGLSERQRYAVIAYLDNRDPVPSFADINDVLMSRVAND